MKKNIGVLFCLCLVLGGLVGFNLKNPEGPKIEIESQKALYGSMLGVKISGLESEEKVNIKSISRDDNGIVWKAEAKFQANKNGQINLEADTPLSGDYEGVDPLGLFWSMKPMNTERKELMYTYNREESLFITLSVTDSKGTIDSAIIERYYENPQNELAYINLDEDGLKGTMYYPSVTGEYSGIILLTGSNGGDIKWLAKSIASNGFSVLTLPYFRYPGLPDELINIPIEYFEKAIEWMKNQNMVSEGKLGLVGGSRGGELVLQLGSMFDEFDAIVAWSPAAHLWQGENYNEVVPSWTFESKALPYLGCEFSDEDMQKFMSGEMTSYVDYFESCIKNSDPSDVERARIKVERIRANLFFLAGTGDNTWPSANYVKMMIKRLTESEFPYEYKNIRADGAGHMVFLPDMIPGNFRGFNGGSPDKDLKYSLEAWDEAMKFLHLYLD